MERTFPKGGAPSRGNENRRFFPRRRRFLLLLRILEIRANVSAECSGLSSYKHLVQLILHGKITELSYTVINF